MSPLFVRAALLAALITAACSDEIEIDDHDEVYMKASSPDTVTCAASIEWAHVRARSIEGAMRRALRRGEIVELFAHDPDHTVPIEKIEQTFALATKHGLPFVTYRQIALGEAKGASLAFSFDDNTIDDWYALRPLLDKYGAKVTFFVSKYPQLSDAQRAELQALAHDGHDIEYHTTHHEDAPSYVAAHGMAAYLADDIEPGLKAMIADGYDPIVFAYPFGFRTAELDDELLTRFALLRSVWHECPRDRKPGPHGHADAEADLDVETE